MAEKEPITKFKVRTTDSTYDLTASNYKEPYEAFKATYHDLYDFDEKKSRDKMRKSTLPDMEEGSKVSKHLTDDMFEYRKICGKNGWILPCDMSSFIGRIQDCRLKILDRISTLKQLEIQKLQKEKEDRDAIAKIVKVADTYSAKNPVDSCLTDSIPGTSKSAPKGFKPKEKAERIPMDKTKTTKSSERSMKKSIPVEESSTEESSG